jgi:hypothetical protein
MVTERNFEVMFQKKYVLKPRVLPTTDDDNNNNNNNSNNNDLIIICDIVNCKQ